ncbi:MAG: hypothetical protein K5894_10725 [Lachnospiraceae bacterium]|nr:hypothetical protein [Lachnospiraceae bacterium]
MRKKGLSVLLALSMVFTMNTIAFAGEATDVTEVTEANEEVREQYDQSRSDWNRNYNQYIGSSVSVDTTIQSINGTTLDIKVWNATLEYNGRKINAADLDIEISDNEIGYKVPVKKIKIIGSNKKANATGEIRYKITGLYNWKYLTEGSGKDWTPKAHKAALKTIKAKFNTIKNTEFKAYIKPRYIYGSVSASLIKELKKKKELDWNDINYIDPNGDGSQVNLRNCIVINEKNGKIKSVQLPVLTKKYFAGKLPDGSAYSRTRCYKLKLKKLKSGTDYVVSGDSISFAESASFSGTGSFKAK